MLSMSVLSRYNGFSTCGCWVGFVLQWKLEMQAFYSRKAFQLVYFPVIGEKWRILV